MSQDYQVSKYKSNWIEKLACKFGIHEWSTYNGKRDLCTFVKRKCKKCNKKEFLNTDGKWLSDN